MQITLCKYFSYFSQKTGFNISRKLTSMKCQNPFSEKNKKNIINLSSAELALRVLKIKY